jgi:hypothetical protein
VEQFGTGSGAEGVEAGAESALELIGRLTRASYAIVMSTIRAVPRS